MKYQGETTQICVSSRCPFTRLTLKYSAAIIFSSFPSLFLRFYLTIVLFTLRFFLSLSFLSSSERAIAIAVRLRNILAKHWFDMHKTEFDISSSYIYTPNEFNTHIQMQKHRFMYGKIDHELQWKFLSSIRINIQFLAIIMYATLQWIQNRLQQLWNNSFRCTVGYIFLRVFVSPFPNWFPVLFRFFLFNVCDLTVYCTNGAWMMQSFQRNW